MAGRVPLGADRAAVAGKMETTFIENLRYAADLLAQVSGKRVLLYGCSTWATQHGDSAASPAWGRSTQLQLREGALQSDLLLQEDIIGLVEPINNRITDPRYYLNTPHQGKADLSPPCFFQGRRRISKL